MTLWDCQSPLLAWKNVGNECVDIDKHLPAHFWGGLEVVHPAEAGHIRIAEPTVSKFCFMDLCSSFMEDWQVATNATCPWPCNVPFQVPLVREYAPSSSVARLRCGKLDKDWCSIYFGDCSPSVLRKPYIPPPWEEAQSQPLGEMWPRSTCCLNHPSSVMSWRSMRSLQRAADLALRSGQFTPLRTVG